MDRSLIEIQAGYDEPMEDDLTWLAKNVHEWPSEGLAMMYPSYFDDPRRKRVDFREDKAWIQPANVYIAIENWQQRRSELQNKPSWDDAPEWAEHLVQNAAGAWYFIDSEPKGYIGNHWHLIGRWSYTPCEGRILGNWRNTLEKRPESKPDQIPQPAPSLQYSPEDVAFNSMDQMCGPEAYHQINHSEQSLDMVKQERYKDANGEDWIDEFARTSTVEEFRGAMRFTIGKYNRRVGKKDEIIKEIRKMKDYCHRWELYELGLKHDGSN